MLITLLNDGTLISIGYDNVRERDIPEKYVVIVLILVFFYSRFFLSSLNCVDFSRSSNYRLS